jgi:hypothetical protein
LHFRVNGERWKDKVRIVQQFEANDWDLPLMQHFDNHWIYSELRNFCLVKHRLLWIRIQNTEEMCELKWNIDCHWTFKTSQWFKLLWTCLDFRLTQSKTFSTLRNLLLQLKDAANYSETKWDPWFRLNNFILIRRDLQIHWIRFNTGHYRRWRFSQHTHHSVWTITHHNLKHS